MKDIAWIGVGIMGKSMVRNLQKAGFRLHIYARDRAKVEDVIQEGALFYDTIGGCVQGCQAVVTMVGFPRTWRRSTSSRGPFWTGRNRGPISST